MIRLQQYKQLVQAAYQLADGADNQDLHVLALMADHLELHNTHMHAAIGAGPSCPQIPQQTHVCMQAGQAEFERFKILVDALPDSRHHALTKLARRLCESADAPDLVVFAAKHKLDVHALKVQRAQLIVRGAEAYLVFLRRLDDVGALPYLKCKEYPQQSHAGSL